MANQSKGQNEQAERQAPPPTASREPPVRRWPHPVSGVEPARAADPMLHYIRCALSYQNQQLADIKALLQRLLVERGEDPEE